MNKTNFTKEQKIRDAVLLIRVLYPKNFLNLDQTKQRLELACIRAGLRVIDIFYWDIDDPIRRDKIIETIKKLPHRVTIITNELDKGNQQILDLNKFAEFKRQKIAKIYVVDAENIIYQREEDL